MRHFHAILVLGFVLASGAAVACPGHMHVEKDQLLAGATTTPLPQTPAPVRLPAGKKS